ncbi:pectin lyase fold/virulence factor [Xylariales sp. PMI_506]|nr:pectin lyase fold/virulence factor [Xylariales sp. PMI_506]
MRWPFLLVGFGSALTIAQQASGATTSSTALSSDTATSSSSVSTVSSSSSSSSLSSSLSSGSTTITAFPSIITVAADGSGQFSVINSAIAYAQSNGHPTVTIKSGTYSESVVIQATATVTVLGETSSSATTDYSKNLVTISNNGSAPLSFSSTSIKGITWRNVNFVNIGSGSTTGAVYLKGSQHAFYACQFVSAGSASISSSYAAALIADSYIEAADKAVYLYPSLYIYSTTITTTSNNGLITYTEGATDNSILYNSTVVFDSCTVTQKAGSTNTNVYLFAANSAGSVVLYRNSSLGSFLATSGTHSDTKTLSYLNSYSEFENFGAGSYANNVASREQNVTLLTEASQLARYEIPNIFASVYPTVATSSTSWIDQDVLARIQGGVASQDADATSSSSASSSASSAASLVSSTAVTTTVTSATLSSSSSIIASSSAASSSGCVLPTSIPSTAKIVGPAGSCASYTNITAAVAALPADSTTQYVYILAGTYTEQITISREGSTIFRGETDNTSSYSANTVTIQTSSGLASSSGNSASTAAFVASQYYTTSMAFYNIDFANEYPATTNEVAVAFVGKALKTGFYGCSFKSSQGTLLLNYGAFYFANCYIEGTTDLIWGQGGAYFYNSEIVSTGTTSGQSISAQSYQSSYGPSLQVFDSCAIVPSDSSVPQDSTYLGRDYSTTSSTTSSRVIYINSYLDAHIAPVGWKVTSTSTLVNVTFVEANNTGPGASTSSRSSYAQILADGSAYTVASVLGSDSWLDTTAIAPFAGFPDSVYDETTVASSSLAATSTTASVSTAVTSSATSTSTTALYTVAPTPTGSQYGSVMSAVAALPADGNPYTIYILAGTYTEQVVVNRTGLGKVTLVGETSFPNDFTQNLVTIEFYSGVSTSLGEDEITPVLNWKRTDGSGLALYNIDFVNTYEQESNTAALAADFYGTNMAAYGCSFKGYQDTLLANQGVQVFSNCYIEGSVDFIWGYSKAYFHQCYIASNTKGASITAQNRPSSTWAGGYIFDTCYVTYTSTYGSTYSSTYLGRPWSEYAVVVYMNSYLDKHISSAGWSVWSNSAPQTDYVMFGEYNNSGPGAWSSSRATFATNLTAAEAASYTLSTFIGSTSWIDSTAYNYVPSYPLAATTTTTATTTSTSSSATATWAHPTDGTTPPTGAVLVSVNGTESGSYSNLTSALASLPDDDSTQIIFMYPGTYDEQVPSVNRDGPVMIIGYTSGNPGQSYKDNTVTVTNSRGLSVSPLPTGHSDAETATFSTASTKIAMYNIVIENSDNLDGSLSSYVTLAGSIYGNEIGFYGCSFIGWQDTLLTGATAGYQYYESCYIEGAIDFIWGYSKAYFKGCTIGAKRAKSAMTAQSRASLTAIGGYIFDQCLFTAAADATVDLTQTVYLGRPYSEYALVVVKNSYLDSLIAPSGWKVWSTSSPNTDYITFAEYNNSGPGNWENNAAARVAWENCTLLTSDTYPIETVMGSTDWIDLTYWDSIVTPSPDTSSTTTTTTTNTTYDGTTPPAGAFIVSKTAITNVTTYDTIQSALDALPTSSKVPGTIFIYPGEYEEQLVLSKSGTTIFLGYSTAAGDYTQNQVTITYDSGVDTQADESNSDSATVYATGNYFEAVNINFKNTFGTTTDYATLGFGVKSSKYAALYGCQVYGNQDALLINGYFFASNSYIEGNIDMIWGSGAGYFLNSTISPNEDKVSLTADKRTDNTTAAGFVFDQCTITPADGASFSQISLGRPWNEYARVAYINSYLDSCVESAGWNQWSSSNPQTDGVLFGEMGNYGPGSSVSGRASFATQLTQDEAVQFQLANFFASTSWINMTLVSSTPFVANASTTTVVSTTSTSTSSITSTSTATTTLVSTITTTIAVTTTAPVSIVTEKTTTILDVGTTFTADPTTHVVTSKSTSTITATVTKTDKLVTSLVTVLVDVGSTITPAETTSTSVIKSTLMETSVVTSTPKATTVKVTTTVTSVATSTPKASTTTISEGNSVTETITKTPGTSKVTSHTTITEGTGGTTTTTAKATTVNVSITTTKTVTTVSTTSISCTPAALKFKRTLSFGDADAPLLFARATPAVVVTVYSYTTSAKTTTTTIPAITSTTTELATKTTGKTTTLKPQTITETTISVISRTVDTTVGGSTSTTIVTTTKATGKTTTLKAATATVLSTSYATKTTKSTVILPASTTTSSVVVTVKSTTVLPVSTTTVTKSTDTTIKTTLILATPTTTTWKTSTVTLKPSVTETVRSTTTKTETAGVTTTITTTTTKTKAGAAACTN